MFRIDYYFPLFSQDSKPDDDNMIVLLRKDRESMDLDTSTTNDQPQCRLLSLPAELRNQIWLYVLVQCRTPALPAHHFPAASSSVKGQTRFCANVLRTCKRINEEATPILYGENVFSAHPTLLATLPSFSLLTRPSKVNLPPVIYPRVMKFIRRYTIFVRLDTDPGYSKKQVEESFNGCDELEIDVFQAMYGSCDFTVLKLFEGVRGVGHVNIQGSLGDRRYADWLTTCMESPPDTVFEPFYEKYVGGVKSWDVSRR